MPPVLAGLQRHASIRASMRWSPVRVVAESEPIHQTSRQAAQRASRAWPATHQFEKLARRELPGAENFHLDTMRSTHTDR